MVRAPKFPQWLDQTIQHINNASQDEQIDQDQLMSALAESNHNVIYWALGELPKSTAQPRNPTEYVFSQVKEAEEEMDREANRRAGSNPRNHTPGPRPSKDVWRSRANGGEIPTSRHWNSRRPHWPWSDTSSRRTSHKTMQ